MGGEVYLYVDAKREQEEILGFMVKTLQRLVNIFNFFDESSTLSRLNRNRSVDYDKHLAFVIEKSQELYTQSKGLFNICLGEAIAARKKDQCSISKHINPHEAILVTSKTIEILHPDCLIDLGGIAKGYILDQTLQLTRETYSHLIKDMFIDGRGDCVAWGTGKKEVVVDDPFYHQVDIATIFLQTGAIVTSGHDRQQFKEGSHIIGTPSNVFTLTLYSKKRACYELDGLATYLLQLPSQLVMEEIEFNKDYEDIECVCILEDGTIAKSVGFV